MTTSFDKSLQSPLSIGLGYESEGNVSYSDFHVPPCSVEDVDRAIFEFLKSQVPFYYLHDKKQQRVPVIFSTGERFAISSRNKSLRDKSGRLILPLISISRVNVDQVNGHLGAGQTQPIIIKQKLSEKDPSYQNLINQQGILNQDDVASPLRDNPEPGQIATRRENVVNQNIDLKPSNEGKHIYEIISIPPTRFFRVRYEIAFWCDYMQQANQLMTALMQSYHNKHQREVRLESEKGYWFVGRFDESFASESNFDNFTDSERIVKVSISAHVNGYTIEPDQPGMLSGVRRYISSPEIQFDVLDEPDGFFSPIIVGAPTGNPSNLILQDFDTLDDPLPGQGIADQPAVTPIDVRGNLQQRIVSRGTTEEVGDSVSTDTYAKIATTPSGEKVSIKARNVRKGETVFRTYGNLKLEDLF